MMLTLTDSNFIDYINSLEVNQLRECHTLISNVILDKLSFNNSKKSFNVSKDNLKPKNVNDFVVYNDGFINNDEKQNLSKELKSLHFNKYS